MREYQTYSSEFKKAIVKQIKNEAKITKVEPGRIIQTKAQKFNIAYKTMYRWFRDKSGTKRKANHPQMQTKLVKFIRNSERRLKTKEIAAKAKELMESCYCEGATTFHFSKGWFQRFKRRMAGGDYDTVIYSSP